MVYSLDDYSDALCLPCAEERVDKARADERRRVVGELAKAKCPKGCGRGVKLEAGTIAETGQSDPFVHDASRNAYWVCKAAWLWHWLAELEDDNG